MPGCGSITVLFCAVDCLVVRESVKFQLIDESVPRERREIEVRRCFFGGLLVPVRSAVVGGIDSKLVGEFVELQLTDQAGVREAAENAVKLR